jgi:hypothetical protein
LKIAIQEGIDSGISTKSFSDILRNVEVQLKADGKLKKSIRLEFYQPKVPLGQVNENLMCGLVQLLRHPSFLEKLGELSSEETLVDKGKAGAGDAFLKLFF